MEQEPVHQTDGREKQIQNIRERVNAAAARVAELGNWPAWIGGSESLLARIPEEGKRASGFDAGIACALDLIPRDKQTLPATLHANYSIDAVEQARKESLRLAEDPDSETVWWLAACHVCREEGVDIEAFLQQLREFSVLANNPTERSVAAQETYEKMLSSFTIERGYPFGEKDGCIQGAYLAGHSFGTHYASEYGIYFIGTNHPSLGLEEFAWSEEKDERGRNKSGPVFGSKQFVKCATEEEFERAVRVVQAYLKA